MALPTGHSKEVCVCLAKGPWKELLLTTCHREGTAFRDRARVSSHDPGCDVRKWGRSASL